MDRFQMPSLDNPLIQSLLPSVMGGKVDIKDVADKALKQGLQAADSSYEVDSHCLNHTEIFLESLISGQKWALKSKCCRRFFIIIILHTVEFNIRAECEHVTHVL